MARTLGLRGGGMGWERQLDRTAWLVQGPWPHSHGASPSGTLQPQRPPSAAQRPPSSTHASPSGTQRNPAHLPRAMMAIWSPRMSASSMEWVVSTTARPALAFSAQGIAGGGGLALLPAACAPTLGCGPSLRSTACTSAPPAPPPAQVPSTPLTHNVPHVAAGDGVHAGRRLVQEHDRQGGKEGGGKQGR